MSATSEQHTIVATCGGGLEPILEQEIRDLPGTQLEATEPGIVRFRGPAETIVPANRCLRTASRVLLPLGSGPAQRYDDVYALAKRVPWDRWISADNTFAVTAITRSKALSNHKFLAMRVKDAVVDRQRDTFGRRSNVERKGADYPVVVHAADAGVEISLDTSGRSLHERGYRREAGEAPLRESLAAGMVLLSDWDGSVPLFDPFCGSGTIAIEAALIQAGRVPGDLGRRFAFERWPQMRGVRVDARGAGAPAGAPGPETGPDAARAEAAGAPGSAPVAAGGSAPIIASDKDPDVVEIARRNARRAGVEDRITFLSRPFEEIEVEELVGSGTGPTGVIITNPPYGERIPYEAVAVLYQMIGDNLKARYTGWSAWIITANLQAAKRIGLRSSSKTILYNGGLESRLYEFQMY
jgi:putative N6-adenine-specific DNA methylase